MTERGFIQRLNNRVTRPVAGLVAVGALAAGATACDGGGNDQVQASPTIPTATTRDIGTVFPSTVRPESSASPIPSATQPRTPDSTPTPLRTPTLGATAAGDNQDMAVRFGEAVGPQNNWLEVASPESLNGLSEFTLLARVKLRDNVAAQFIESNAIASKGESVEAFAVFTSIATCLDAGMAAVIDGERICSGQRVPKGRYVNLAVIFKDKKIRFLIADAVSVEKNTKNPVPLERGKFFIGASPKGADEGFSGEIDDLIVLNQAISPDMARSIFGQMNTNSTRMLLVNTGNIAALWTFDRIDGYKDLSGRGNDAVAKGQVSQVPVAP